MLSGIDHLVVVVPDLAAASRDWGDLGFTVVPGGRHPIGTHNALIALADGAYMELIAFFEPNLSHRWFTRLGQGGGLVDLCLVTDDLAGDTAAFRAAGVPMRDPAPLTRTRPDGYTVKWVLAIPGEHGGVAPFLIEDETPRTERVPRQTGHANGVIGVRTVTLAVEDPAAACAWYARVLGRPGVAVTRPDLDAAGLRVEIGHHAVEFLTPRGPDSPLGPWLAARGPSPWSTTLSAAGGRRGLLDPRLTGGARLIVE